MAVIAASEQLEDSIEDTTYYIANKKSGLPRTTLVPLNSRSTSKNPISFISSKDLSALSS